MIALGLPVLVGLMGRHFLYTTSKFRKLFNGEAVTYGPRIFGSLPVVTNCGLLVVMVSSVRAFVEDYSEDKWLPSVKDHLENGWLWVNLFSSYGYHIKKGS